MTESHAPIELSIDINAIVNYASFHNHVPFIRSVTVKNTSSLSVFKIRIQVEGQPLLEEPLVLLFDELAPGELQVRNTVSVRLSSTHLSTLAEAENTAVIARVFVDEREVSSTSYPVELLAYDQWAGARVFPELLAAFVTPNHLEIDKLVAEAGRLLGESDSTSDGAMRGYQAGTRESVWEQINALYHVVAERRLVYSAPPASFGMDGQKIRTPDRIFAGGVATCLDFTVLLASALEQAGLHPLVLVKRGHAWVGCWLIETDLGLGLGDDAQTIRKRVTSGELVLIETTGLGSQPPTPLRTAIDAGFKNLEPESDFYFALDVHRARMEQILPLPHRWTAGAPEVIATESHRLVIEPMPELPPLETEEWMAEPNLREPGEQRLARWKGNLLDLTLRNRLLNFKDTRHSLPLVVPDLARVEDSLTNGQEWRFRSLLELLPERDPRSYSLAALRTGEDPAHLVVEKALENHELLSLSDPLTMADRLHKVYNAARLGLEEAGANTLFLAMGFLQWREVSTKKSWMAPLLLLPVSLSRRSVRSGFSLRRHEDDTVLNPTLLQLLKQSFQLTFRDLDVLPKDQAGIDVARILQTIRNAVVDIAGWEVHEGVSLGIFSFAKYVMWKDLQDRTPELRENHVVAQLMEVAEEHVTPKINLNERHTLDAKHSSLDFLTPLDADSSQLHAISWASEGHDLVLEGPPGTGKSQTITNLIAHLMGTGKRVLFVSEKMAALEVVQSRLASIGLAPFCLELHSAKARKAEVIGQFRSALSASFELNGEEWQNAGHAVDRFRADLNEMVDVLHRTHENGLSIRRAFSMVVHGEPRWQPAQIRWSDFEGLGREALDHVEGVVATVKSVVQEVAPLTENRLASVRHQTWSPTWEEQLLVAAERTSRAMDALRTEFRMWAQALPTMTSEELSLTQLDFLAETARLLVGARVCSAGIRQNPTPDSLTHIQNLRSHGERRLEAWKPMASLFRPDVTEIGEALYTEWRKSSTASFFTRWRLQRAVRRQLQSYALEKPWESQLALENLLKGLEEIHREDVALSTLSDGSRRLLGPAYRDHETDWSSLAAMEAWLEGWQRTLRRWPRVFRGAEERLLLDYPEEDRPWSRYVEAWQELNTNYQDFSRLAGRDPANTSEVDEPGWLERLSQDIEQVSTAKADLRSWCRWQEVRAEAVALGLLKIVEVLESGQVAPEDLEDYWRFSYAYTWVRQQIDHEPRLRAFSRTEHMQKIVDFRRADELLQALTARYLVAKLVAQVALVKDRAVKDPEYRFLLHEINKKKAHKPLRVLFKNIPTLLSQLKPCLLMSPLSVAQYLEAGTTPFDVVIFDEASQIPVWEAVGAMARGTQVIVVGDPKQLPPTNFFAAGNSQQSDEVDEDAPMEDLESILDESLGVGLPTLTLAWHYRSRHESLISFSNQHYYQGQLLTFPGATTEDTGVSFRLVDGVYDRGRTRTNRIEADAVVDAVQNHFQGPNGQHWSLGVVTFNQAQQQLIEELWERRLSAVPHLEALVNRAAETLFIKNLENVQGDERDVVFFSTTFGKDEAGRMAMTFGPLNKEGGHRRLNVAITRARTGVVIFSSMKADDIDLTRTKAQGVLDFREYLAWAANGGTDPRRFSSPRERGSASLEEMIAKALKQRGWMTQTDIGLSNSGLDIGVIDPQNSDRYLLGILTDGESYRNLPTARDRERLREKVLKRLGWELHRLWAIDWWTDPEKELDRIEKVLQERLSGNRDIQPKDAESRKTAGFPVDQEN